MHQPTVLVGVTDHLDPELQAMLLAKYSRSYGSITERLPTDAADAAKIKARLREVYLNYGHRSVGQLAHTTIYFEGVSMLAAIAIEVNELFNGQESSTRYIDFTTQPAVNDGDETIVHWQEVWRQFYKTALDDAIIRLKAFYPPANGVEDAGYERTIKARAFDICGGILPAGFTTCVGFTGSFDVLNDHITWMAFHPLAEVRQLAQLAAQAMLEKFPNAAFSWAKIKERGAFMEFAGALSDTHVEAYYYRAGSFEYEQVYSLSDKVDRSVVQSRQGPRHETTPLGLKRYPIVDEALHAGRRTEVLLEFGCFERPSLGTRQTTFERHMARLIEFGALNRKKYQSFPRPLSNALRFRLSSVMDFRSYRDVHRHRNGFRPLPLLTLNAGVHAYYLQNLPFELSEQFEKLLHTQRTDFALAQAEAETPAARNALQLQQQYAIPMAMQVPYYFECDLNQLLYMVELRTDKTVHQTVRIEMMAALDQFKQFFPAMKIHADLTPNNFTLRRGQQTCVEAK